MAEAKVKSLIVLNAVTLESTEAATQAAASRKIVDTYLSDQLNVAVKYTTGASETTTNCYVKVWGYMGQAVENESYPYASTSNAAIAADAANWIQLGAYDLSTGTAIFTPTVYKLVGGAGATAYTGHFSDGITFTKIRVSAYEDGVSANKGTITVAILIQ